MFKVKHLTKLLTIYPNKTICTRLPVSLSTNVIAASNRTNLTLTRLYSDKNATNKNTKVCKQGKEQVETHPHVEKQTKSIPDEKCSDEKIPLKQCKPIEINPCIPPSGFSPAKIPSLQECPTPNLMSESPQPGGNWDEQNKNNRKKYARILTIGLIVSAVSIAAVYFTEFTEKPTKKLSKSKKKSKISTKIPADSSQIPKHVPYLLIGGGTASFAAFRAIKSTDPQAKVLVVTTESYFPYMRPPLSKEIWYNDDKDSINKLIFKQWNGSERSLFYEPEDFYTNCEKLLDNKNGGVAVARGWTVTHLDAAERRAYLDDGSTIQYDKCLIATGAKPKILPVFEAAANNDNHIRERVRLFRNIEDFKTASELFDKSNSVAVIGGGFLGSELACALARKGKKQNKNVYQIFRESGNMGKILPEYLSYWTTDKVKSEGVNVLYESDVQIVRGNKKGLELELQNGKKVNVDFVIVAVGVEPDTALAKKSNLETDPEIGGFLVNAELQARSDLYIAGDCSCFYDPLLGRRRIEHHDHAVVSGRLAGENMTGASKPYTHQSMFWSDLGPDVGYEAIGLVDSKLPTVGVFAKATVKDNPTDNNVSENISTRQSECTDEYRKKNFPNQNEGEDFSKGVIFYLKDDIVVGIVLWNVFNRMSVARQVLKDQKKYDDLNEVAKLFNIHED